MSTAGFVPETASWELGDGPVQTVRRVGLWAVLVAAFVRLRRSDGFSHARAVAFVVMLLSLQGTIAVVAVLVALGSARLADAVDAAVRLAAPGPIGQALGEAVHQARDTAELGRAAPLVLGLGGALVLGTTGVGQLQRALNRLYGMEVDRPSLRKYARASILAMTAGTAMAAAFVTIAFGRALDDNTFTPLWRTARLPITLLLVTAAVGLMFRWSPDRRQPPWPWLLPGAAVAVAGWVLVTIGLAAFFRLAGTFHAAYGALADLVALGVWSLSTSIALLFGAAVNAEVEHRRGGPLPAGRDA